MPQHLQDSRAVRPRRGTPPRSTHAIELLRHEHRRIRGLLSQFERSQSEPGRAALAEKICHALIVHMLMQQEIFFPAFLESTDDRQLYCQALVEQEAIQRLVTQVCEAPRQGELFAARMAVLLAMLRHHMDETEKRDGMLAEATCAGIDCEALGERMRQHRELLKKRLPLLRWRIPPGMGRALA